MTVSSRTQLGLQILCYLTLRYGGDPVQTSELAAGTGTTEKYIGQIMLTIRASPLVLSSRGAQGGYRLGKPAEDITVGDILRTVEGSLAPVSCLDKESCPSEAECRTRFTWQKLYTEIQHCIDALRISDLVRAYHSMEETEGAL